MWEGVEGPLPLCVMKYQGAYVMKAFIQPPLPAERMVQVTMTATQAATIVTQWEPINCDHTPYERTMTELSRALTAAGVSI